MHRILVLHVGIGEKLVFLLTLVSLFNKSLFEILADTSFQVSGSHGRDYGEYHVLGYDAL
jgi:hypothetical protein